MNFLAGATNAARARAYAALFCLLFLSTEWLGSHLHSSYSPFQVVWMRYLVHLLLVIVLCGRGRIGVLFRTRRPRVHIARSLLMLAMPASWIVFVQGGGNPLLPLVDFAMIPLATFAAARLIAGTPSRPHALLVSATMAAAALLVNLHSHQSAVGLALLATIPAICVALYVVATGLIREDSLGVNLFQTAFTVFLLLSVVQPRLWVMPSWGDVPVIVAIASIGLLALVALDRMVHLAPIEIGAPFIAILPLWGIVGGLAAHGHLVGTRTGELTAAVIAAALLLSVLGPRLSRASCGTA